MKNGQSCSLHRPANIEYLEHDSLDTFYWEQSIYDITVKAQL